MFKKIFYWELVGFIFALIFGTLLHFTYEWSNKNLFIASFSAVNESTWEHLKLLFTPMLAFSILEYLKIGHNYQNFMTAKVIGILLGLCSIISFVYIYTRIVGENIFFIDISIFVISVLIAHVISYLIIRKMYLYSAVFKWISIIILCSLIIIFALFTYFPPNSNLFIDPTTQNYGI